MQLSLVDSLRCPAHEQDSALILSVERWDRGSIDEGELGCPACQARYRIRKGAVEFTSPEPVRQPAALDAPDPLRLAAQLGLGDESGLVLLAGLYAAAHNALTSVATVTCLLVDAPPDASVSATRFELLDRVPLVDRSLRGAAMDEAASRLIPDLIRCIRPAGRIVARSSVPVPASVRLLAQDDLEWVGEVPTSPIQLQRPGRRSTL